MSQGKESSGSKSSMGMNMGTMIQMGAQLVIIGGVAFWLNRKINGMETIFTAIEKKFELYEQIISKQQQVISRHESILQQLTGVPSFDSLERRVSTKERIEKTQEDIPPEELDKIISQELEDIEDEDKIEIVQKKPITKSDKKKIMKNIKEEDQSQS